MDSVKAMDSPETGHSPTPSTPTRGMFYQLQIVLIVAFILATLFTAWTPASLLPGNLSERFAQVLAFQATETAAYPTPTARPRPLIGLVVGHWDDNTKDPGAVCADGLTEFEINQAIATRVKQELVDQAVWFTLSQEGVTTYSLPCDVRLWPLVLDAATRYEKLSDKEQKNAIKMARQNKFQPLFPK